MVTPYDSIKVSINFTHGELPIARALELARRFYPNDDDIYQEVCKGAPHYCIHSLCELVERIKKIIDANHAALVEIRDNFDIVRSQAGNDVAFVAGIKAQANIARKALEEHE